MRTFTKDPDEVLDYSFDWSEWLSTGDTIAASEWFIDDIVPTEGLILSEDYLPSFTDTTTTVWLDNGVIGQRHYLTNRITTADGRIADRTVIIKVLRR